MIQEVKPAHRHTNFTDIPAPCLARVLEVKRGIPLQEWTELALLCKEFHRALQLVPVAMELTSQQVTHLAHSAKQLVALTLRVPSVPCTQVPDENTEYPELCSEHVAEVEEPLLSLPAELLQELYIGGAEESSSADVFRPARVDRWLPRLQALVSLRLEINSRDLPHLVASVPSGLRHLSLHVFMNSEWHDRYPHLQELASLTQLTHLAVQTSTDEMFPVAQTALPTLILDAVDRHEEVLECRRVLRTTLDAMKSGIAAALGPVVALIAKHAAKEGGSSQDYCKQLADTLTDLKESDSMELVAAEAASALLTREAEEALLAVFGEDAEVSLLLSSEEAQLLTALGRQMQAAIQLSDVLFDVCCRRINDLKAASLFCVALHQHPDERNPDGTINLSWAQSWEDAHGAEGKELVDAVDRLAGAFDECGTDLGHCLVQICELRDDIMQPQDHEPEFGWLNLAGMTNLEELTVRGVANVWLPRTIKRLPRMNVTCALPMPGDAEHICLNYPYWICMVKYTKITNWRSVEIMVHRASEYHEDTMEALRILQATPTVQQVRVISSVSRVLEVRSMRERVEAAMRAAAWRRLPETDAEQAERRSATWPRCKETWVRAPPVLNFAQLDWWVQRTPGTGPYWPSMHSDMESDGIMGADDSSHDGTDVA